jgi:hypothetical protein
MVHIGPATAAPMIGGNKSVAGPIFTGLRARKFTGIDHNVGCGAIHPS